MRQVGRNEEDCFSSFRKFLQTLFNTGLNTTFAYDDLFWILNGGLVTGASIGILGSLMVLDSYRPWLLAAGSVMLTYSFFKLYIRKAACACEADVRARRVARILFWSAASLFIVALTYQKVLLLIYG